ncbi:MAG: hypothetical protein RIE58_07780 [Vicingaceae bacterium]
MNKKWLKYGLLALVVLVWTSVIVQLLSWGEDEQGVYLQAEEMIHSGEIEVAGMSDTLLLNYRDPFLERSRRSVIHNTPGLTSKKQLQKAPAIISWPGVEYNGSIGSRNQEAMAMIKINGVEKILKAGVETDGLELNRIFKDSILVTYSGEHKTIRK